MISCEFPQIKFNKFNIVSISIYVIITNEFHWLFILRKVTQRCYVRWRDIRGSHNVACGMVGSLNHDLLRIGPLVQHDYHHHLLLLLLLLLLLFIVIYLLLITQANPSADHNLTTNDEQYEKQSKSRATKQHVYKMKCLKLCQHKNYLLGKKFKVGCVLNLHRFFRREFQGLPPCYWTNFLQSLLAKVVDKFQVTSSLVLSSGQNDTVGQHLTKIRASCCTTRSIPLSSSCELKKEVLGALIFICEAGHCRPWSCYDRVGLLWTASILSIKPYLNGSHTCTPYSNRDLNKVLHRQINAANESYYHLLIFVCINNINYKIFL